MASISKTTTSINVPPGSPISFTVTLTTPVGVTVTSFMDSLPLLPDGGAWVLSSQPPPPNDVFVVSGPAGAQSLTLTSFPTAFPPGNYTAIVTAPNGSTAGDVLTNTVTVQYTTGVVIVTVTDTATATVAICAHGSLCAAKSDPDGRSSPCALRDLEAGDVIRLADGGSAPIVEAVPCWAGVNDAVFADAVIFEKDSLAPGVPTDRCAIDAGHPICTQQDFDARGMRALRPARTYSGRGVRTVSWDKVASLLPGENRRYDVILPEGSCQAYLGNGLVIQARRSRKVPGYSHI